MDAQEPIVIDTSVLLNFLRIGRLDLIAGSWADIRIVDHVQAEVQHPDQIQKLAKAIDEGVIIVYEVDDPSQILEAVTLIQDEGYGPGECYSFVLAKAHALPLALDDRKATSAFTAKAKSLSIINSQAIMVRAIKAELITLEEADRIKDYWAVHCCFKLKITSFSEFV